MMTFSITTLAGYEIQFHMIPYVIFSTRRLHRSRRLNTTARGYENHYERDSVSTNTL